MRQRVTLTEGQLRRIVEDASRMVIQEMIDEGWWDDFKSGAANAWNGFKDMNQKAFNSVRGLAGQGVQAAQQAINNSGLGNMPPIMPIMPIGPIMLRLTLLMEVSILLVPTLMYRVVALLAGLLP